MRLNRLKNDLIATVSHELKTPLSSMRVLVDTLLEGRSENQIQTREYLELIAKENRRLSRLIDNFLSFSRMTRNKQSFHFERIEPHELVREAVSTLRDKFDSPERELHVDVTPNLPRISGDRDALLTVLLNLLDNAIKYTPDEKRISVRAHAEGDFVRIEVGDNGVGLSRADKKRVFDRFYRVDRRLVGEADGCGLGLSIVKSIVESHRGSVSVESELGKGSVFVVKLPRASQAS